MTAGALLAQLERDPEFVARREAQQAKIDQLERECAADERFLVAEVRASGYRIESVWDLVNNRPHPVLPRVFVGPYPAAYPVLVRHLGLAHHKRIREGIVRALTVKDGGPLVEEALLGEFSRETDSDLRWVLANALKCAIPYHRRRKHYPEIATVYDQKGA